jgi:ubiquinone/menaquinone biosynthesis C-methylase UbiE
MVYWEDFLAWATQRMATIPKVVVDVGCGSGNLIECLSTIYQTASICGVDLSEASLKPAKERFKENSGITFRIGSLDRLPLEGSSVNLVTCTEVLEHTFPTTFTNSFSEVSRVLEKGGYYLASVPFDEKINVVSCPECGSVFTPHQHMMFEITQSDILDLLSKNGLELIGFYQSLDRSQPNNSAKSLVKSFLLNWLPSVAGRIFPKAGVSGFLARRVG